MTGDLKAMLLVLVALVYVVVLEAYGRVVISRRFAQVRPSVR